MSGRHIRIGLLWHSVNSPNLGVGALTLGHLEILDDLTAALGITPHYLVIGSANLEAHYIRRPDLAVRGLRTKDFVKPVGGLASAIRACDVVLDIGGGDSFADIYGASRFRRLAATKAFTLALGRPLVLAPQTIGPFERGWARRIARWLIERARLVATRDQLSTAYLTEIGYSGPRVEATDVALRLSYRPADNAGGSDRRVRVGLNVSGLLFRGGYTNDNMFSLVADYPTLVRQILARLSVDPAVEIHLISHVLTERSGVEDDYRVAEQLAQEFRGAVLAPRFADPSEAKSYIAGMDFFAGARMHACIAAFSAGVAMLPMAYSRKFAGLFGSLGYDLVADCVTESAEAIEAKFFDALARRKVLAGQAKTGTARGLAKLGAYEAALAPVLEQAAYRAP